MVKVIDVGYKLLQAANLHKRVTNSMMKKIGITQSQFITLYGIQKHESEGNVTLVTLANSFNMDRSMTSTILKKLLHEGFITRKENPKDTRYKNLALTQKGRDVIVEGFKIVEQVDNLLFTNKDINLGLLIDELDKIVIKNSNVQAELDEA